MITLFFLDACALARYFFQDIGAGLVQQIWTCPDSIIIYDWLILTETVSVFAQTKRDAAFPQFDEEVNMSPGAPPGTKISPARAGPQSGAKARIVIRAEQGFIFEEAYLRLYRAAQIEGLNLLHLWSCQCSSCGRVFIAQKGVHQECPHCGKVCERCSLRYCDNQITLTGLTGANGIGP